MGAILLVVYNGVYFGFCNLPNISLLFVVNLFHIVVYGLSASQTFSLVCTWQSVILE